MTPMRAIIVGPPSVATRISASHCGLPFCGLMLYLRELGDIFAGILERDKLAARAGLSYLILAKHSFRRSSSKRTCDSMASCNASVPLLDNSAEAFLSRFCFQSRIACLVALWASDAALRYVVMQASAIEHVWHS